MGGSRQKTKADAGIQFTHLLCTVGRHAPDYAGEELIDVAKAQGPLPAVRMLDDDWP